MSRPLRILLLLLEPPLPFGNPTSRWYHVLYKGLLERGHTVRCLVASGTERDIVKAQKMFADVEQYDFHIFYFDKSQSLRDKFMQFIFPHKNKFNSKFMEKFRDSNPDSYDIIHIEQTWTGWVGLPWANKSLYNIYHMLGIDLKDTKNKSLKETILFMRWFLAERQLISRYPYVRTCSDRLKEHIQSWGEKRILQTIPVGIDPSLYSFIESSRRQRNEMTVTVVGNMSWYPSSSAAKRLLTHLWPKIHQQLPQAKCHVVGWSARSALKDYLNLPNVEIYEDVPDIRPYFEQASLILYAPQRGTGMKVKVLEAMLYGVPVVTTSEGVEGLPAEDMIHCGIGNSNEELVCKTIQILNSEQLQENIRTSARKLVELHCSPQKTVDAVESIYSKILENNTE